MAGDISIRPAAAPPFPPSSSSSIPRPASLLDFTSFPQLPFALPLPNSQSRFAFTASKNTFSPRSATHLLPSLSADDLATTQSQSHSIPVQTQPPQPPFDSAAPVNNTTAPRAGFTTSTPGNATHPPTTAPIPSWVGAVKAATDRSLKRLAPITYSSEGIPRVVIPDSVFQRGAELHKDFYHRSFHGSSSISRSYPGGSCSYLGKRKQAGSPP
ncbi:unnamed protein product [Cochlearia groenlandica]